MPDALQSLEEALAGPMDRRCEASLDPDVTMLGFDQEAWLRDGLEHSRAR